jgi:ATP-dependent protease ClpP protease subunit
MFQINISGIIGWETTADSVREQLKEAGGDPIEAVISSPGGLVSEGLDIFNQFRNYKGEKVARLSGFAMSMGSYIPLCFDRVIAEENAVYMMHNVSGGVWGDHNEILSYGAFVKSLSGLLSRAYVKRSGIDPEEIATMMDATTYLFGEEIVERGFADELAPSTDPEADTETAMVTARLAFRECTAKLAAEVTAVKEDMRLAAQMITGPVGIKNTPRAQANASPATDGAKAMNLEKLKAEHPDLVAAIEAEACEGMISTADLQAQIATASSEGAETERARIQAVEEQAIAGQEDLIAELKFDGKTSGPEAAVKVLAAVKADQGKQLGNLRNDAPAALAPAGEPQAKSGVDENAPLEERAKAEWDGDAKLRAEFGGKYEGFFAWKKAEESGAARVLKK